MAKNAKYFEYKGLKLALNLNKLSTIDSASPVEWVGKELTISQVYNIEEEGEIEVLSKAENETKDNKGLQKSMFNYDIVGSLINTILTEKDTESLGVSIAVNTLLKMGILEIIS